MQITDDTVLAPDPVIPLIAWVGDAPGLTDRDTRTAWSGPSGRLLRDHYVRPLAPAHHLLTTVLTTYQSAKPAASAYKAAWPALRARLYAFGSQPCSSRVLVVLGSEPCSFVHSVDRSFPSGIKKALSHQLRTIVIDGLEWTVLFTYNPGHVLMQPNLARAADNHHRLLRLHLASKIPARTRPHHRSPAAPDPAAPRTIVLDIETYGAVTHFDTGTPAPSQKDTEHNGRFHPARSIYEDAPESLVVTAAITVPARDTSSPQPLLLWDGNFPHSRETLMRLEPGTTYTFNLTRSDHRAIFAQWLRHADTIIGHNLLFDLQYLLFASPLFRAALPPFSKHLIDSCILAYLQDETRPEKSLKDLGPLLGLFIYEDTLKHNRFSRPSDPRLHRYNAEDTHNTLLLTSGLAALIDDEWASTDKAQHECLAFYSRTMWSVLPMLERGVPFSIPKLLALEAQTRATIEEAHATCLAAGLQISGTGSKKSSVAYIQAICDRVPDLLNHNLFALTEKTREISTSALNIKLCKYHLPPDDPAQPILDAWLREKSASKLLSSYIVPLLYASQNTLKYWSTDPSRLNRTSTLIPEIRPCSYAPPSFRSHSSAPSSATTESGPHASPTDIGVAYPRVYITPSPTTDSSGDEGGTEQLRLAIKGPALQTLPAPIRDCQAARRSDWGTWEWDLGQIELKVPALFSGEPKLIAAAETGFDLHTDQALTIFGTDWLCQQLNLPPGTPLDKNTPGFDPYRQCAKQVNFAGAYWAAAPTMQLLVFKNQEFYVPLEIFNKAVAARPTQMPEFYRWQESLQKEATGKGYLNLPLIGLSRHFTGGTEFHKNVILNFKTQALAAAILLDMQHRVTYRNHPDFFVTYQVHDSLKGEYRLGTENTVRAIIDECLHQVSTVGVWGRYQFLYNRKVPLSADFKFSGEKK